jgi:hypothetical protein
MFRNENLQVCIDTSILKHEGQRSISVEAGHFVRCKRVSKNMYLVVGMFTQDRVFVILRDHHLQQQVHLLDLTCCLLDRNRWLLLLIDLCFPTKSALFVANPKVDCRKFIQQILVMSGSGQTYCF